MKFLLSILLTLFVFSAQGRMVYMQESGKNGEDKQIVLMEKNKIAIQLTDGPEMHLYPDISSDGQKVVYVQGELKDPPNLSIVIEDLKKNEKTILATKTEGLVLHPKFTKNGEYIFFSAPSLVNEKKKNTIYYFKTSDVNNNSVTPTALDDSEEAYFPRPSSDGNMVVYQRNTNGKREIILFDRLENKKIIIAEGMSPALSFDERFIAYTSKIKGSWDIFQYDRIEKTYSRLTRNDSADEMAPTYMADNSLVFSSNASGRFNLYKLDKELKNADWIQLTNTPNADNYAPQFSGDITYKQGALAPFMEPLRSSFGTLFHEGKLYMCGGHQGPEHTYPKESFTDNFNVYDPKTNSWKELPPRPVKAHGYQIAAKGNYIYAFGGFTYSEDHLPRWTSLDQIDRYDIENNTWTTVGNLPRKRSSNVAITIKDKVYLIGGWDSTPKSKNDFEGTFHAEIDIFDLATESSSVASFTVPLPLRRAFTGVNYQDNILLIGGLGVGSSHFDLLTSVTMINPETGKTKELPPMPFGTFAPAAEVIGSDLFVFGGMFKTGEMAYEYVSHIYKLNLKNNEWSHTGRYLKETKGFSQVFKLNDSTVGILGGHKYFQNEDRPVNTFETFTSKP